MAQNTIYEDALFSIFFFPSLLQCIHELSTTQQQYYDTTAAHPLKFRIIKIPGTNLAPYSVCNTAEQIVTLKDKY